MIPKDSRELATQICDEIVLSSLSTDATFNKIVALIDSYVTGQASTDAVLQQTYKMRAEFHHMPENERLWRYCNWMDYEVSRCEWAAGKHYTQLTPDKQKGPQC